MKRHRLEQKRFVYQKRDPSLFYRRFGIRPGRPKPLPATNTLVWFIETLAECMDQTRRLEVSLDAFFQRWPRLKLEYAAFLKSDFDPDEWKAELRRWMIEANERGAPAIVTKKHLALVVDNVGPDETTLNSAVS